MRDPFRPNSNQQIVRESQIGLSVVAVLIAILVWVGYYRIMHWDNELPESVRNAPVAELVWPGERFDRSRNSAGSVRELTPKKDPIVALDSAIASLDSSQPKVVPSAFTSDPARSTDKPLTNAFVDTADQMSAAAASLNKANSLAESILAANSKPKPNSNAKLIRDPNVSPANSNAPLDGFPTGIDGSFSQPVANVSPKDDPFSEVKTANANNDFRSLDARRPFPEPPTPNPIVAKPETESGFSIGTKPKPFTPLAGTIEAKPIGSSKLGSSKLEQEKLEDAFVANEPFKMLPQRVPARQPEEQNNEPTTSPTAGLLSVRPLRPSFSAAETEPITNEFKAEIITAEEEIAEPIIIEQPKPFAEATEERTAHSKTEDTLIGFQPITSPENPIKETELDSKQGTLEPKVFAALIERDGRTIYCVEANDDLWSIAQKCYGDGRFFRALHKFNESNIENFDALSVGLELAIPQKKDLIKLWPGLCPRDTVTAMTNELESDPLAHGNAHRQTTEHQPVIADQDLGQIYETQPGDTLFEIARQRLGQASRYAELWRMNEVRLGGNVNHLTPLRGGIRLEMPLE
jgi:nucleoid-associated protein YgaU